MRGLVALSLLATAGCLEPLVDDVIIRDDLLLAAGSSVPDLAADPTSTAALAAHMPPETLGPVRARRAFHADRRIVWWDLGAASQTPVPAYVLVAPRDDGELLAGGRRLAPIAHPIVLTAVPGDLAYGPLVRLVLAPVTARYAGELLTSREAIDHAVARGLLDPPLEVPYVQATPVVLADARLEPAPGEPTIGPARAFYEGRAVHVFAFERHFAPGTHLAVGDVYTLRREGGEELSEILRGVDLTGDGDADDTNDLFARGPGDIGYTPVVRVSEVVVAAGLDGIDTLRDDRASDLTSAARLFLAGGAPDPDVVRGLVARAAIVLRPFALAPDEAP